MTEKSERKIKSYDASEVVPSNGRDVEITLKDGSIHTGFFLPDEGFYTSYYKVFGEDGTWKKDQVILGDNPVVAWRELK
jgi:hypothetical protein